MARFERVDLTVEEAAQLLRLQPATVRRRLRSKQLRAGEGGGVRLSPQDDWLPVEDAAALLGVAPATVRSNIKRGRLVGRREDKGRWRVQLASVLADRRVDDAVLTRFVPAGRDGSDEDVAPRPRATRRGRSSRDVFVRLYDEEPELLERCVDRHGSIRVAVVEGLRAIDDDPTSVVDVAELRAEQELQAAELERVRTAHRNLSAHAQRRLWDQVYCHHCERLVPISELQEVVLEDGTVEAYHKKHRRHRRAGRLNPGTVIARRVPIELDT